MRRYRGKSLSESRHLPVMADAVIELLESCPEGVFIDATLGGGGHLKKICETYGRRFKYLGFDLDGLSLKRTKEEFLQLRLEAALFKLNFSDIADFLSSHKPGPVAAILYDLGISSYQIDDPVRGFSYLGDGPLSLSFDSERKLVAAGLIDRIDERQLAGIFKDYGQEPNARSLARAIKRYSDEIVTTATLAAIIRDTVGSRKFIKAAARVFQALRIAANHEFENIEHSLETVLPSLVEGGRAIVITYHSLEDRLVRRIFKKFSGRCVCPPKTPECRCGKVKLVRPVTAKALKPSRDEIILNPRARSAKLRVVEKIAPPL
jgi:16S rRNA (cytosine1402-N4)-methyltransferase